MADTEGNKISSLSAELQDRPGAQDHGPFKNALELPNVFILECLHRLLLDRRDPFAQFSGIALYECLDQQRDVFFPLP